MTQAKVSFREEGQIIYLPGEMILPNPYQPRRNFKAEQLQSLAQSIKENGILQPLTVRKIKNSSYYELVAGERRLRASIIAGLSKVPCLVVNIDYQDSAVFSLLENLQRENLDFFEEAESLSRLISNFGMTQDSVGKRLGKSQSALSNKLRLLKLPQEIRIFIQQENLSERHARALLRLNNTETMWKVLKAVKERSLNVSQTEKEVEKYIEVKEKPCGYTKGIFKDVRLFVNTINNALDTMRRAGIDADSKKTETDEFIEFVVRIPKAVNSKNSA